MTSTHMPAWAGSATPESGEALTAANGQGFRGQGTTDSADCANADAERKRFERLRALLALRGRLPWPIAVCLLRLLGGAA